MVNHPCMLKWCVAQTSGVLTFGDKWHRLLRVGYSSCHPTNSVKALKAVSVSVAKSDHSSAINELLIIHLPLGTAAVTTHSSVS